MLLNILELITQSLGVTGIVLLSLFGFMLTRYKRCPSNKILVISGKVGKGMSAKCVHGGGVFIWPIIQDWQFLSLRPMPIEIELHGALSKQNIRINTPSTFTVGVSTKPEIMVNAAERLLGLGESEMRTQAVDIILGQLRLVIATLSIEEINQDREQFLSLINQHVATELNKIGLDLINVNIKDITDESGYINAIGRKSAAEAVNLAKVEVAQQERNGSIGEAIATREREVQVAMELASAEEGKKHAEAHRRVAVAESEAKAVEGENFSRAKVADYNAGLAEKTAEARRRSEVANAHAQQQILESEKQVELARLEKEEIILQEIEKRKVEIEAEATAEQQRRLARGEADAILMKYQAEAQGLQKLLEAKAMGYREIIAACQGDAQAATTLLLIEKLEGLVAKQMEAIANLKIDKITVWEGGNQDGQGATANFIRNFITTLPPVHELAKQVGIEMPGYLGSIEQAQKETGQLTN